jgi:predicted dehydrogenase
MDAFRKAIDAVGPGGVVLLATPPVFRPLHFEYAVEKGLHVFMEKSFGVDFPGAKRVLAAGERAKEKNLKIATGLMTRHCRPVIDTIKRIHDGEIGDVIAIWCYRMQGSFRAGKRREGVSELAYQIQNFNCFPWLNGSLMLDWLIHSIDVACWAKGAWPVSAQGQGGRSARTERDQMYDHFAVDYTFPDGTKLMAMVRQSSNCYDFRGVPVHGTKGSALVGEKFRKPAVYSGYVQERKHATWRYRGPQKNCYQVEHDDFFRALRNDEPYNETDRSVKAAMASMLGRMAAYSGKLVTWDEAMASGREMTPGIDQMTMDSPAPVKPDKNGNYPLPKPGMTKVLH